MLYKSLATTVLATVCLTSSPALLAVYGKHVCNEPQYECYKVKSGESWGELFPDPEQRMLVKKVNRMNTPLSAGMVIAVPKDLASVNVLDLAPLPQQVTPMRTSFVQVDLSKLAWGAYDTEGKLVNWGPVSGGKSYCPDVKRACRTVTGTYTFYSKQGPGCVSSVYPIPHGGAPMPYCMHFKGGYALHGSPVVPGHHASHGCVRLFFEDAMWLNREFVKIGSTLVNVIR